MKRRIKFFLVFLAISLAILTLSACKKKTTDTVNPTVTTSETSTVSTADEKEKHLITFDTNGGDKIASITVHEGETVALPTPSYGSYSFRGWYLDNQSWTELFTNDDVAGLKNDVTLYARFGIKVSFMVNGGDAKDDELIDLGSDLSSIASTARSGYIQTGWFYDSDLANRVFEGDTASANLTLYAGWSKSASGIITKVQSVSGVKSNSSITVSSSLVLDETNISTYISCENSDGASVSFAVSSLSGEYILKPKNGFMVGMTYTLKSLDSSVSVVDVAGTILDTDTTVTTFTVYNDSHDNTKMVDVLHIKTSLIVSSETGKTTYVSNDADNGKSISILLVDNPSVTYKVGNIISIGEGETTEASDAFLKITAVKLENATVGTTNVVLWYIEGISPELEDIYSSFDTYASGDIDLSSVNVTKEQVLNSLSNEGTKLMEQTIISAISVSPQVTNLRSRLSTEDQNHLDQSIATFTLGVPSIKITHPNSKTIAVTIGFTATINVANICTINISLTYGDSISVSYAFDAFDSGESTLNPFKRYYIATDVNLANQFTISFSAEIAFSGTGNDGSEGKGGEDGKVEELDITSMVKTITNAASSEIGKISDLIKADGLSEGEEGSDLNYVELFRVPIADIPIPVTNIITFSLGCDAVVQLGAKAGLYVDLGYSFSEQLHFANGTIDDYKNVTFYDDGFKMSHQQLANDFTLSIKVKGRVGLRLCLDVKFTIGVLHTNAVSSVYASVLFGPYVELTGIAVFDYKYDFINKASSSQVYGGMFVTYGLHFEVTIGIKTPIFNDDAGLWSKDYVIVRIGSVRCPIAFTSDSGEITSSTRSVKLTYGTGALNINYINLINGDVVSNQMPYWLSFNFTVADEYKDLATIDSDNVIHISPEFKGTYLSIVLHVTAKDTKALVGGKTLSKDIIFTYRDYTANDLISYYVVDFRNTYSSLWELVDYNIKSENVYAGFKASDPFGDGSELPVRPGYYLDRDHLWIKYVLQPISEGSSTYFFKEVTDWDGNFTEASGDERYVLNWKAVSVTADFYVPNYDSLGSSFGYNQIAKTPVYFSRLDGAMLIGKTSLDGGIVPTDFSSTLGYQFLKWNLTGYSVSPNAITIDKNSNSCYGGIPYGEYYLIKQEGYDFLRYVAKNSDYTYSDLTEYVANYGINVYASYTPIVYKVNWVIDGMTSPIKTDTYNMHDYIGKSAPLPSSPLAVGTSLSGLNYYLKTSTNDLYPLTGEVTGFLADDGSSEITSVSRDITYTILYSASQYELIYLDSANGAIIKSAFLAPNAVIPSLSDDEVKAGEPYSEYYASFTYTIATKIPSSMPSHCLILEVVVEPVYGNVTMTFNGLGESFLKADNGVYGLDSNGLKNVSYTSAFTTSKSLTQTFTAPTLKAKDTYDVATETYKTPIAWKLVSKNGVKVDYISIVRFGQTVNYTGNEVYEPTYATYGKEFTVQFRNISDYGTTYTYAFTSGLFKGKKLSEIMTLIALADPSRKDVKGQYSYTFTGWGVDPLSYVIGSETDLNGNELTTIVFDAQYSSQEITYTYSFKSGDGSFAANKKLETITAKYGDIIDLSTIGIPSKAADGTNSYIFTGWTIDEGSNLATYISSSMANEDRTYYAIYVSSPLSRTVTLNAGKVGDNEAYLDGNTSLHSKTYTEVYDGEIITIYANSFTMMSDQAVYEPLLLKTGSGENEKYIYFEASSSSLFPNYANIIVNGDETYTVVYDSGKDRNYYTFLDTSYGKTIIYDSLASEGSQYSTLVSSLMGYVHGKVITSLYNSEITLPLAFEYDTAKAYIFKGWVKSGDTTYTIVNSLKVTEDASYYPYFAIDNDALVTLNFEAEPYDDDANSRTALYNSLVIMGLPHFSSGDSVLTLTGKRLSAITNVETPTLTGYEFVGWRQSDSATIVSTLGTSGNFDSNLTYYAVYQKKNTYTIKLEAGEGSYSGNNTEITVDASYGTLLNSFETPTAKDNLKVFSCYLDSEGNAVNMASANGTCTALYAYPIKTLSDLMKVDNLPGADYVLQNNISLEISDSDQNIINTDFHPLGLAEEKGFSGTFNGNGHEIMFIYDATPYQYAGLFGKLSGKVFNLIVSIESNYLGETNVISAGGIAGIVYAEGTITSCQASKISGIGGLIKAKGQSFSAGAIAGINEGTIQNVFVDSEGAINEPQVETDGIFNYGFAVGENRGIVEGVITLSGAYSVSYSRSIKSYLGGIAGKNTGLIKSSIAGDSINVCFLNGDNVYYDDAIFYGGIAGIDQGEITKCYTMSAPSYSMNNITLLGKKCEVTFQDVSCYSVRILDKTENPYGLISYRVYFDESVAKVNTTTDYFPSEYLDYQKISSFGSKITYNPIAKGSGSYRDSFTIESAHDWSKLMRLSGMKELESGYLFYLFFKS